MGSFIRSVFFPLLAVVLFGPAVAAAQSDSAGRDQTGLPGRPSNLVRTPTLRIPRVSRPPQLAEFLTDTPREAESSVTDFRQREPGDGVPISEPTTAYLSYDDKNLYIVFVCQDDPGQVRGRLAKREDAFGDDLVAVMLDTFHDRQRAYFFLVNPRGIQADAIYTEGQGEDYNFDTLWHSEGHLLADGYIVWIAIPFKSLRFRDEPTQIWGIGLGRSLERRNETAWWPHITQRVEGVLQQLATVEGLEQISPGRNLQFIPYGLFARARFLDTTDPSNPAFRTENDFRGGLDSKFVLRDALTLDVTLNPDFSQVESDEPQVTINQRFEVFFPEKRPFFIENAAFFQASQAPNNLFFSRRILDPQFGVRLTGKVGRWAIGGLVVDDRGPGKLLPETDPRHDDRAGIGALRVQREFGSQSAIGVQVTSRDFAQSSNRVFSLDTRLKLNPNWVLVGQAIKSYTHTLGGDRFFGPAYSAGLTRSGRHFFYSGGYLDRSPKFRTELGFVPRVDIRQTSHFASYTWRPERRRLVSFGPEILTLVNWNRAGQVQDWIVDALFHTTFIGQTEVRLRRIEAFELFRNIGFRKHVTRVFFTTGTLRWVSAFARYSVGNNVNFFPGPNLAPFLANASDAELGVTLRPTPRLRFDQTYIYSRLGTRQASTPPGFASGTAIFNNYILRSKLNYQFNREFSLRMILDYNAVLANPELVQLERSKRLTADFLLTYLVNPGTAVHIGYTDRYANLELDPGMPPGVPPSLRMIASPTTSVGRQVFVKLSYLFRF